MQIKLLSGTHEYVLEKETFIFGIWNFLCKQVSCHFCHILFSVFLEDSQIMKLHSRDISAARLSLSFQPSTTMNDFLTFQHNGGGGDLGNIFIMLHILLLFNCTVFWEFINQSHRFKQKGCSVSQIVSKMTIMQSVIVCFTEWLTLSVATSTFLV